MTALLRLWLLQCAIRSVVSEDHLIRLYRTLLDGYEKEVRPALRHDHPINVSFVFSLTQIIDVDERNQIMTTNAWVRQLWRDYKLVWDPRDYGNITKVHIPYEKIWRPDIILYNNADSQYTKSVMSTDIIVNYMGDVTWTAAGIFKSSCPLDVRYYPFDRQMCLLKYASWAYDGTKIDILIDTEKGDDSNYMESTEWHLLLIRAEKNQVVYSCCPDAPYPYVDIHIAIERRPMFYVFNLILPCMLISGIALLGFYMPSDSGEKVTLGITSLLSTTVFLMLVAEGMPPTSEALPLIGVYYLVTIFIVSLATAMNVITLNVHHHGIHGNPVPQILQAIAFRFLARLLYLELKPYHSITSHVKYVHAKERAGRDSIISTRLFSSLSSVQSEEPLLNGRLNGVANSVRLSPIPALKKKQSVDEEGTRKKVSFCDSTSPFPSSGGASEIETPQITPQRTPQKRVPQIPLSAPISEDPFESEFLRVMSLVHGTIERNEMRLAEKDRRDATQLEWQQVAMVLDRFLLFVFIAGTATTSFLILYQRQLGLFE